jgi:hypothetical protein
VVKVQVVEEESEFGIIIGKLLIKVLRHYLILALLLWEDSNVQLIKE